MEKSNQLPKTEDCLAEGEPADLRYGRLERPSRSVFREKCEPQAGDASGLSNSASKAADASGDGVSVPEPNTETPVHGADLYPHLFGWTPGMQKSPEIPSTTAPFSICASTEIG